MTNATTLSFPTPNYVLEGISVREETVKRLKREMIAKRMENKPRGHIKARIALLNAEIKQMRGY